MENPTVTIHRDDDPACTVDSPIRQERDHCPFTGRSGILVVGRLTELPQAMRILALFLALVSSGTISAQLTLSVTQPCGPGSVQVAVSGAGAGAELFNLVQFFPATPTGSGPFFGLGVTGSDSLLTQILSPLPTPPFHVSASGAGTYTWTVCGAALGISIPIDVVTLEWGPAGYVAHTPVTFIALSM